MWMIEDELHGGETIGEFATRDDGLAELQRLAVLPWTEEPNQAPCMGWRTCGRNYELVEYDISTTGDWKERQRLPALSVSQGGVVWHL